MSDENEVVEGVVEEVEEENNELDIKEKYNLPDNYMDYQAWQDAGKDPNTWMSPKAYNDVGSFNQANNRLHEKIDNLTKADILLMYLYDQEKRFPLEESL